MAGFGSPVASPDPIGQGVSTLNGVLGLKQRQQALQIGQQQLQSQTAEAQQAQQKNQELQQLAQFTKSAAQDPKYHNPDGSLNVQKYQTDAMAAAPTYGQAYIGQMTSNANAMVDNRKALLGLANEQRQTIGGYFGAVAAKPNASVEDFANAAEQARGVSNDPAYQKAVDRMLMSMPQVATLPTAQASAAIQQHARGIAMQTNAPNASVSQPTNDTMQGPNGLQPVNLNPLAPGGTGQQGTPLQQGLAPTEQPAYKQAAAAAAATGGARATGVASSDIDRANQVSANIKPAQAGIQTTQQIDDLADQIHSGKFAAWVSKNAAAAGASESTYARQLLEKDLGIVKTQLTSAAPSDSRAATILSGTPEATSDPQTIHGAMDYVRGSLRQNLAQGQNLSAYKAKHPDLSGFQGADDAFTGGAGPLVHEFLSLKGKDAQAAFYRRNFSSPEQALQFRNQTRAASHTLGLDNADR